MAYSFNGNFANSGMNEKGLQADLLYLGETRYDDTSLKEKSIAARKLIQYVLDHFATVEEAKKSVRD
ncbi:linear amide C-N hydrolase [Atlantibacter hermannii]|uniref:linear amide C-N hydrolase n=1 Tax=Atlantibacter hermannii TaxID=565 RepID=UPI002073BF4A|nr:linear amide C-N hydrolase [Atlantibacter hermannii]